MKKIKYLLVGCMSVSLLFSGAGLLSGAQDGQGMMRRDLDPGVNRGMKPPRKGGPAGMFQLHRIVRGLELTEEQRVDIREILSENKTQVEQAIRNILEARANLDADAPESAEAFGTAHTEAALLRVQVMEQIEQILTEEQLNRLQERKQLRQQRFDKFPNRFDDGVKL